MINTVHIKAKLREVFTVDTPRTTPEEVILIVGSCRSVAYLNYLEFYNRTHGHPFRIHFIDPFDHNWDEHGNRVDFEQAINARETDPRLGAVLKSTSIYIHEFYKHFGMFNSSETAEKNIFQFGLKPKLNICIPNFNDLFILFNDLVKFDPDVRTAAFAGGPRESIIAAGQPKGMAAVEKFYSVCRQSSFPEMEEKFRDTWKKLRYFWTSNHVSSHFTLFVFAQMVNKFLRLDLNESFWGTVRDWDMFKNPHTGITEYDRQAYGLEWAEPDVALSI